MKSIPADVTVSAFADFTHPDGPIYVVGEDPALDAMLEERRQLICNLSTARRAVRNLWFTNLPELKSQAVEGAFLAMADVGAFNRTHPEARIEPLAGD